MSKEQPNKGAKILLVDDDDAFRGIYTSLLEEAGYAVDEAANRAQARAAFDGAEQTYDAVLLDLMLPPDGSVEKGLEMLGAFLDARPDAKIVVVSGAGDARFTLQAVRRGAYDFLTKPVDPDVIEVVVERAVTRARLERRVATLQNELDRSAPDTHMIGEDPAFLECMEMAARVAAADLPILLSGENGTGKELMARFIHDKSPRADEEFLTVNCGALTESLLESTLFGHIKGAFTGAHRDRKGLFAQADGGTLFLDEVGDMPPALQVKVLRVIEYGEILPVGADRPVHVDVRILSATNKDLMAMQADGEFREDLYWRIKGAEVVLPPLRERPEDIGLLARHFLNQSAHLCNGGIPRELSPEAESALLRYPWPGNLRQLRHEMQRASVMAGSRRVLTPEDFALSDASVAHATTSLEQGETLQEKIQALERREILAALKRHDQNRTHAAADLGLSRQGLLNKMDRYGID